MQIACDGLLPIEIGAARLSEVEMTRLTSLAPKPGQEAAFSKALKAAHGMALPAPTGDGQAGARALWFGKGQGMLIGPEPGGGVGGACGADGSVGCLGDGAP